MRARNRALWHRPIQLPRPFRHLGDELARPPGRLVEVNVVQRHADSKIADLFDLVKTLFEF